MSVRTRSFVAGSVLLLVVAGAVTACGLGGDSSSGRPELQRVLDDLVEGDDRVAPGATAYVAGPEGVWTGFAGLADVDAGLAMPPDARMRLESVSKAWTATLILQLVGEGRMGLDDTVETWLPGLLPDGERITVRQLLDHTSGLIDTNDVGRNPVAYIRRVRDPQLRAELEEAARGVREDPAHQFSPTLWIRLAAALPFLSEPGSTYHYSNIGYEVAGAIAERVGGAPLARLYRERISEPLSLASVAYDPRGDIEGPHAVGYAMPEPGEPTEATAWYTGGLGAEGGIVSNATDEARFLTALMRGELLRSEELEAMKTPSAASADYGLGLVRGPTGCAGIAFGHGGGGAGFKTSVLVSPDGERVAVLLLNGNTTDGRADEEAKAAALELFCAA
jgi:D-alanyl-D-alanine carboxypeptidase